jgi:hypothetical protein
MTSLMQNHIWLPEPRLLFHPDRLSDTHLHPLKGLQKYGPYGSAANIVSNPIKVATISPFGQQSELFNFLRELERSSSPRERLDYLIEWPGFQNIFQVRLEPAEGNCQIELPEEFDGEIQSSDAPHQIMAEKISRLVQHFTSLRDKFDVLFIMLPERWSSGFYGPEGEDFNLHDFLKAQAAIRRIPLQIIREDKALKYSCRASVMWRIGLALYVKAGGTPWKLSDVEDDMAYIGLSYAVRNQSSDNPRFVTCCSQVFDADGSGLDFVAYNANDVKIEQDNPYLSHGEMYKVMARSLQIYQNRHAGKLPRRVAVHKTSEFKKEEIDGAMEALNRCEAVDLIQIVEDVSWRGVLIQDVKKPSMFPVKRGSVLGLGPFDCLLWTHGDAGGVGNRGSYYQGGKATPKPIRIIRHAGHGPWDDCVRPILALTKMNWNNDALYDMVPVTIGFAGVLASVVKRIDNLGQSSYPFRFFM